MGVDAQAALRFHHLRESAPALFFSRLVNQGFYALLGLDIAFRRRCVDLPACPRLRADGADVALPEGTEGLIFLNIDSYAGGARMWRTDGDAGAAAAAPGEAPTPRPRRRGADARATVPAAARGLTATRPR